MKPILVCIIWSLSLKLSAQKLQVQQLRCNYQENPMGIAPTSPSLSWQIATDAETRNILQTAYRIQVATDIKFKNAANIIWDTKKKSGEQSLHIEYKGRTLQPKTRYYWRVKVWDNHMRQSNWSEPNYWESGITDVAQWQAKWITPDNEEQLKQSNPAPMLRKQFELANTVKKATLYISSRGIYHATINGKSVTNHLFTPGWTTYNKRTQYQVYDVTNLLHAGENATGVVLADGWYRGNFGFQKDWYIYGKKLALLYQLEVEYNNGKTETIISDQNWRATTGPVLKVSIYDGELYDANFEKVNWDLAGVNVAAWNQVTVENYPKDNLVPTVGVPVRRIQEVAAIKKIITPVSEVVIDFGQNLTGRVRFKLKGKKGDTITILHSEVLDNKGNFYTENLRAAKQQVQYIFKNDTPVEFEPEFTFQGFRYIQIKNFKGTINKEDFTAVVIHSDMEPAGNFVCSDSLINQLHSNIRWSMRGNFLDVPTDCPQRDERLGWTGDVQAFASTSMYLYNSNAFYAKWLQDLDADQLPNGNMPHVIPYVGIKEMGSTGWGDVATILPYNLYLRYGDKKILERQYRSMKSWVDFLHQLAGEDLIVDSGFHYGDWLFFIHPTAWNDKPGHTDKELIATAYLSFSANLVGKAAAVLGKKSDAEKYTALSNDVKGVFQKEFITATGRLSSSSQTAYTLALAFNLMPNDLKQQAVRYLTDDITKRNYHLSTGFLGTPHLCHVLSENGQNDIAYKLLMQKTYPSWIYPITKGATTVWERWDGIKPDGSFQTPNMNSFNHYAYGAIGSWLYEEAAGIQADENYPGYKHIIIKPQPDSSLSFVSAQYQTSYGIIRSSWKKEGRMFSLSVTIPSNSTATIYLPYTKEVIEVGSGSYQYSYEAR